MNTTTPHPEETTGPDPVAPETNPMNTGSPENFCPVSLGDWLKLCREAGVPHVPADKVTELRRKDYPPSTALGNTTSGWDKPGKR